MDIQEPDHASDAVPPLSIRIMVHQISIGPVGFNFCKW
jgi:hypothetical protein